MTEFESHILVKLKVPKSKPTLKVLCVSDTHCYEGKMPHPLPNADLMIHAGDFTTMGRFDEITQFQEWTNQLLKEGIVRHVIFVMGNHEKSMDLSAKIPAVRSQQEAMKKAVTERENVTYLEDGACEFEGVTFYGSPWTIKHNEWAFQKLDTDDEE